MVIISQSLFGGNQSYYTLEKEDEEAMPKRVCVDCLSDLYSMHSFAVSVRFALEPNIYFFFSL